MSVLSIQEFGDYLSGMYSKLGKTHKPVIVYRSDHEKFHVDKLKLYILNITCFSLPTPINVVLKGSPIHGRGVFAHRDMSAGTIITFYPGDIVQFFPDGNIGGLEELFIPSFSDRFEEKFNLKSLSTKERDAFVKKECKFNGYNYDIDNYYRITSHPDLDDNTCYLGHFINDRFKSDSTPKSDALYSQLSLRKSNCKFHNIRENLHVAIVATRDILRGEELFLMYGINYWASYNKTK